MIIAEKLSEYILNTSYADIPDEVKRYTKLCLFDWLGVTLGALNEEIAPILIGFVEEMGGKSQATIIGKGIKTNVLFAALVNGSISHALDYDDTIAGSFIHPSVCLAPALMAIGEHLKVSGKEMITAFAIGFEIASRLGAAAGASHYGHGWHATSTMGRFGAAAGTAKLLNLRLAEIINTFGVAGTQIAGLRETFGTMCKPFNAGKAAMDGVLSAYLAKRGFDSSKKIFEGKYGIGRVFAPKADANKLLDGIGTDYKITGVAFKRYASALATHSTIEAIKEIKAKEHLTAQDVHKIDIELGKLPLSVIDNKEPKRVLESKFSIHHCAALAFIEGSAGHNMFTNKKLNDPKLVDFRKKVKTELNPNFSRFETKIRIITIDGNRFERYIPEPKGSPENPMTFEEMKNKFKGLVYPILSREKAKQIFYKIKGLEDLVDISELIALCIQ
jgi:2-methylcitrate dehydratase PrpD